MGKETVEVFKDQFTEDKVPTDFEIIKHIPKMITQELNAKLWAEPTMEEVKNAIFGLNGDSASGLDGFTGQIYHACWEITCEDVLNMVKKLFCGAVLPKFITHTNLVLLSRKKNVATFSDMRPISLSNFSNKIISRVINERLVELLPNLEVLGRSLDSLFDDPNFIRFGMPKWSKNINYLLYADDTIIFSSSHYGAIQLVMNMLEDYKVTSGQKVNKEKSSFYMYENAPTEEANTVQERLHSWKGRVLSIGGRAVLIAHVLKSIPIYLLSVVNPPKYVIDELHKMFARFFWSKPGNGRAKHWASWATLCLPKKKEELLRELLPDEIADRIMEKIAPLNSPELRDKPFWQLESKGHFSVKTVWQYIRKNKQKSRTQVRKL
ncbi:uncharacterized protein LOC142166440 [Nicotiana tabacum]|uniref:Uncharacterized protein LOC142166440 n=1 Tax=Nicotiana tabacum TaxID=4097 RepID=A0AC58SA13_TOBAC